MLEDIPCPQEVSISLLLMIEKDLISTNIRSMKYDKTTNYRNIAVTYTPSLLLLSMHKHRHLQ